MPPHQPSPKLENTLSTAEFAARNLVKPQTVRKRYSDTGTYHGTRPVKLANRRLAWPDVLVSSEGGI